MRIIQMRNVLAAALALTLAAIVSFQTVFAANATVTVVNLSNKAVCTVFISPVTDTVWTGEVLNNGQMQPWAQRNFVVPQGSYDLRADYCDGSDTVIEFDVVINATYRWEIGSGAGTATSQPAQGNACPESGVWPPGCVPGGQQPSTPSSPSQPAQDNACPESGVWPPGCVPGGSTTGGNGNAPASGASLDDIFGFYEEDVYQFWVRDSNARGETHIRPTVNYVFQAQGAAYYDTRDHSITMSRLFSNQMKERFGDFAVVAILAHEWGHAIQADYGLMDNVRFTIYLERQADCMTGAYTLDAENRGIIGAADVQSARDLMYFVGDDLPWWDVRAHGSSDERVANFNMGYWGGVNACL